MAVREEAENKKNEKMLRKFVNDMENSSNIKAVETKFLNVLN